jgi:putative ABC transport system permease protein
MQQLLESYALERSVPARVMMWMRAAFDILWVALALRVRSWVGVRRLRHGGVTSARMSPFDSILQDIRYTVRSLRRDASLTIFAILIVGLGVGACATVFSVVDALLLRPLPFDHPDELVWISNGEWGKGQALSELSVQVAYLQDLRAESEELVDVGGYSLFDRSGDYTIADGGEPERLTRLRVTENFFQLLGVAPLYGRLFMDEEVRWNGPHAVLLTYGFWSRRFAGDSTIVGRTVELNGVRATVVGVLPQAFDFASVFSPDQPVDFVAPFPLSEETNRLGNTLALIGRMRPGATLGATRAEVSQIAARSTSDRRNGFEPYIVPLHEHVSGQFASTALLMTCAVGIVMLIVCANLSNLLLARGTAREREIAIRAALGARRSRLIRQVLTESLVLALTGAALGLTVAVGATRLLTRLDINIPLLAQIRVDGSALTFTLLVAIATGIVFGATPAVRMSAHSLAQSLRDSGRGTSHGRRQGWIHGVLVGAEVALACVLLVGASLLIRSLVRVMDIELGFQPRSAVALRIDPGISFASQASEVAFYDEALRRVRAAPGVEAVGTTDVLPTAFNRRWSLRCPSDPADVEQNDSDGCRVVPFIRVVSEGYLPAMGLTLISGRDFSRSDNAAAERVIIVNEQLAEVLWPDQNPIERGVGLLYRRKRWNVIGVVRGMRHLTPEQEPEPEVFFSFRQMSDFAAVHLIVRGAHSMTGLTSAVRSALMNMDPPVPTNAFRPIQDMIDRSMSPRRFVTMTLTAFAAFAVLLASLGIFGVISYSVSQRKQEMGIRLALGASAVDLVRQILTQTLVLAGSGMAVGLLGAWAVARAMRSQLFGVPVSDPITFAAAPSVLLIVALCAGYFPARRASRMNPVATLRTDS